MKKIISLVLAIVMIAGCMSTVAFAEESATVFVSIADKGQLVASQVKTTVTDIDNDGLLTVNDALYAVHESVYSGGASAGYEYFIHKDYGLSIGKLWGDTSGNFGYYINNNSCWSLADTVKNGDYINAFVYSDSKKYSDVYCFFGNYTVSAGTNSDIELALSCSKYDANWNPITVPVTGAEIMVDGALTGVKTDSDGKATIRIASSGTHVISAVSSAEILVPPVCKAEISGGLFSSILSFIRIIINFFLSFFK